MCMLLYLLLWLSTITSMSAATVGILHHVTMPRVRWTSCARCSDIQWFLALPGCSKYRKCMDSISIGPTQQWSCNRMVHYNQIIVYNMILDRADNFCSMQKHWASWGLDSRHTCGMGCMGCAVDMAVVTRACMAPQPSLHGSRLTCRMLSGLLSSMVRT